VTTTTTTTPTTGTTGDCTNTGTPPGGGQVGAVVISRYIKGGSADAADTFNHFSLLKTIEDLFSVPKLGYAKDTSLPEFDTVVFNNYTAG
jgi:phospholipase C